MRGALTQSRRGEGRSANRIEEGSEMRSPSKLSTALCLGSESGFLPGGLRIEGGGRGKGREGERMEALKEGGGRGREREGQRRRPSG
eukprot:1769792-Rhodomonas_salina.1